MNKFTHGKITMLNCDCMEYMKSLPDNAFDLAIVDPPYGLDKDSLNGRGKMKNRAIIMDTSWDDAPDNNYFNELFRISKEQIIWGGNYFALPRNRCFVIWDKMQPWPNFSAAEYAWVSFNEPSKIFKFDNRTSDKIHPTQKPVKLYEWLLTNYAKQGNKILDTHGGSFSSAIACHNLGFEYVGCELDTNYFESSVKRIKMEVAQERLFG